jgi:hypothetical protein
MRSRLVLCLLLLVLPGCAKSPRSLVTATPSAPLHSALSLSRAAGDTFTATLALDAAPGASVLYALDPAEGRPIRWIEAATTRLALTLARRVRPYVLLAKTVSADGQESAVVRHEFTADNVVAQARILSPKPMHELPISTPPSFRIRWTGADPEAANGVPSGYLYRLATASDINPSNPTGITASMVNDYFVNDLAAHRNAWTQTTDTSRVVKEVPVLTVAYFAVAALDAGGEAGATETVFDLDRNVLQFRPTGQALGPDLSVSSDRFNFTLFVARIDPTPRLTVDLRAGTTMDVHWSANPDIGRQIDGFRWAVDPISLADASPRRNDGDVGRWSAWSLSSGATIGPFPAGDAHKDPHLLWIEARDDLGGLALAVIEVRVLGKSRPDGGLLLVDDLYGTPTDRNSAPGVDPPTYGLRGPYPTEAEQDSFYNAVGGVPDQLRRYVFPGPDPSARSLAGAFAEFDHDTLDYRFWPTGIDIETLSRYHAVAWYTDNVSASRAGDKFSTTPATALRMINRANQANSLAQYLANGGKVWLFGEGATTAIGNGYWSRFGLGAARIPYTSGDQERDILRTGNFLYDFVHLRSRLQTAGIPGQSALTLQQMLHGAIPYLPEFAGPATADDRSHDPRIGPSAARTARRWSGLPRLTIASYRAAVADPALRFVPYTWVVDAPLRVTEGSGRQTESTMDTLYLCQALGYDPDGLANKPTDGFPNALDYHGSDNGEVVWFGFPLHYFELDQVRQVVRVVMRNFGIEPLPPGVRQGPGAAEPPTTEPSTMAARAR